MMTMVSPSALRLVRLPGEFGPIVRCYGELSVATAEALRRELALLSPLGHPVITLDISGCIYLDVDGIVTVLDAFKRQRQSGRRLVLVAGRGPIARLLHVVGIDWVIPLFPTEECALLALRGGGPPIPAPPTWATARALTVARWRAIHQTLKQALPQDLLHQLTSMTALCERSEELFQEHPAPVSARCQFCPLYYALGGRPSDVGCRSLMEPIIEAVRAGNIESARAQVADLIRTVEEMSLPEEIRCGDDRSSFRLADADARCSAHPGAEGQVASAA